MNELWSYALSAVGLIGLWLTIKKRPAGLLVAVWAQVLWIIYATVTRQWGFIISALAYGAFNLAGWLKWRREERDSEGLRLPGG